MEGNTRWNSSNYWKQFSRRRFLGGTSVAVLGAGAVLANACGSSNNNSNSSKTAASGGSSPSASSGPKQTVPTLPQISLAPDLKTIYSGTPVKGGSFNPVLGGGIPDQYDPIRDAGYPGLQVAGGVLSSLVRAHYPILGQLTMEPDLAAKWEQPDNQTLTFHLQPNAGGR